MNSGSVKNRWYICTFEIKRGFLDRELFSLVTSVDLHWQHCDFKASFYRIFFRFLSERTVSILRHIRVASSWVRSNPSLTRLNAHICSAPFSRGMPNIITSSTISRIIAVCSKCCRLRHWTMQHQPLLEVVKKSSEGVRYHVLTPSKSTYLIVLLLTSSTPLSACPRSPALPSNLSLFGTRRVL
jgi:hypothetical protein